MACVIPFMRVWASSTALTPPWGVVFQTWVAIHIKLLPIIYFLEPLNSTAAGKLPSNGPETDENVSRIADSCGTDDQPALVSLIHNETSCRINPLHLVCRVRGARFKFGDSVWLPLSRFTRSGSKMPGMLLFSLISTWLECEICA